MKNCKYSPHIINDPLAKEPDLGLTIEQRLLANGVFGSWF